VREGGPCRPPRGKPSQAGFTACRIERARRTGTVSPASGSRSASEATKQTAERYLKARWRETAQPNRLEIGA